MWRNWIFHILLVGIQNGTTIPEDNMIVSQKAKYAFTIRSSTLLGNLSQGNGNLCSQKSICMNVHISFNYNNKKMEITQMFFND